MPYFVEPQKIVPQVPQESHIVPQIKTILI
jgi:hypothetical protein